MKSKDGVDDPTLPNTVTRSSDPSIARPLHVDYEIRELLGQGGMGEVLLAHDARIGRDVALKRMRSGDPSAEAIARFEREARIQARLDHPAIVPVHEIGRDVEGRPFFTMKRLAGTTLAELLEKPATGQQKLLRALVDVCLAVELAHSKRVVHRDLKPSNIMLGDFGEVYVLDWGVARVLDRASEEPVTDQDIAAVEIGTQTGKLLGTPGYMAPEQIQGAPVGPPADVYALGSILFEILAGETLHPRGIAALTTTLDFQNVSPTKRRPERGIAPELDAACVAALARDPRVRPSARELGDRIQHYLDGDRDVERRRALATQELAASREALARSDRSEAVRLAGRAVTLDPECAGALPLLTSLIVEPPAELPPAVEQVVAERERSMTRERSRRAVLPFVAFFVLLPLVSLLDVASWPTLVWVCAAVAMQVAVSYVNWRVRLLPLWLFMTVQLVVTLAFTRVTGTFILTPTLIAGMLLSSTSIPWLNDRRWAVIGWTLLAALLPLLLEYLGVFATTWEVRDAGFYVHGTVIRVVDGAATIGANAAILILLASYALGISRDRRKAQRELYVQAWHLQQLLPRETGRAMAA